MRPVRQTRGDGRKKYSERGSEGSKCRSSAGVGILGDRSRPGWFRVAEFYPITGQLAMFGGKQRVTFRWLEKESRDP